MLNRVVLMGRLTADPDMRSTGSGVSVASFSVAVERDFKQDGQKQTDFINITAWRHTAEFVSKYFKKGNMVCVSGSIQTRSYTDKEGNKRTAFEVVADQVYFAGGKEKESNIEHTEPTNTEPAYSEYEYTPMDDDDMPF